MGMPFSDISLYIPTPYSNQTPEFWEESALENFISDLYVRKMFGYKPPKATRICIQPGFYGIWQHTRKFGSVFSVACKFVRDKYESLDKRGKYLYMLDIIQDGVIQLCNEHSWDKTVFETAYREVIKCDFSFSLDFPKRMSRDRRNHGHLQIEKSETRTIVFAIIETGIATKKIKLFEKKNSYWYDCVYPLAKHSKWIDSDKFGIYYSKGLIEIFYSLSEDKVYLLESGKIVQEIDFSWFFSFQR